MTREAVVRHGDPVAGVAARQERDTGCPDQVPKSARPELRARDLRSCNPVHRGNNAPTAPCTRSIQRNNGTMLPEYTAPQCLVTSAPSCRTARSDARPGG